MVDQLGIAKQISELQTILFHFLDWNKIKISCPLQILQALFIRRAVVSFSHPARNTLHDSSQTTSVVENPFSIPLQSYGDIAYVPHWKGYMLKEQKNR
jgi:hypothetical protein